LASVIARPRCRFAPSPTGYLHVGGARTVLFNWLFARQTGGQFLLRIEDTDTERNQPELIDDILDSIRWLDLEWDGDPVHQSDLRPGHLAVADRLVADGTAFWSSWQPAQSSGGPPERRAPDRDAGLGPGEGRALRFKVPDEGSIGFADLIRGDVEVANADIEDFVLVRANGTPMFLLANAVDDAQMGITHVLRGEEHVNGTPKYLLIQAAMGHAERPTFAHLPILVDEQRKKLSKRKHAVAVSDFRARGIVPEAMVNYLALLGWGPPDGVEVRPREELVELFRLEDVNPSPAFFDVRKLESINGDYVRALPTDEFLTRVEPFLTEPDRSRPALEALAAEVQTRVRTLADAEGYVDFLYLDEPVIDDAAWQKVLVRDDRAGAMLDATIAAWEGCPPEADALKAAMEQAAMQVGYVNAEGGPQLAKAQAPVRVALTGRTVGPPLFESVVALGRERTLDRLRKARASLGR
jgi:glutamyl-tRNA synthetase